MTKYIILFFCLINIVSISLITCCPCDFSPADQRPFFEQYEEALPINQEEE